MVFLETLRSQSTIVRVGNRVIISGVLVLLPKALVVCEVLLNVLERYLKHLAGKMGGSVGKSTCECLKTRVQLPEPTWWMLSSAFCICMPWCAHTYTHFCAHTHTAIKFLF